METTELDEVVLGKLVTDAVYKKASAELKTGEYNIDMLVHVTGLVKRGEDYDSKIVAKADPWSLLAMALSKLNGVTVESLTQEAIAVGEEAVTEIKAKAKTAIEKVKAPTLTKCNGKVTADLEVEITKEDNKSK